MKKNDQSRRRGQQAANHPVAPKTAGAAMSAGTHDGAQNGRSSSSYSVESVNRAVDILSVFSHARPELTLAEVIKLTGLAKTSAFRLLATLVERGLCDRDPESGCYSLGFRLLQLAEIRRRQGNLRDLAVPIMREIRDAAKETVVLSVRVGDSRVHIDSVEALDPLRRVAEPGRRATLYAGAVGKLLLAGMSDADVEGYLSRTPLTPVGANTVRSRAALLRDVEQIRVNGFSETRGEVRAGGVAIAAPIRDHSGTTIGALDILIPDSRYTSSHRKLCIRVLLEGARRLSERLGYRQADAAS